jgi:hypothetical protein
VTAGLEELHQTKPGGVAQRGEQLHGTMQHRLVDQSVVVGGMIDAGVQDIGYKPPARERIKMITETTQMYIAQHYLMFSLKQHISPSS